jgi:hypothetical protein
MSVQTTNVQDFFASSEELIKKYQDGAQPQNTATSTNVLNPQTVQESKVEEVKELEPARIVPPQASISTDELLKQLEEKAKAAANPTDPNAPVQPKTGDEPKEGEVENKEEEKEGEEGEKPAPEKTKKGGRPPEKTKLPESYSELVSILEKRGKLVGFEDADYQTVEDFEELLEANEQQKISTYQEEAKKQLLGSLTPAQQTVLQYAEHIQNPADLIPFLTAMDNVAYSYELNPEVPEDAEEIIRNAMAIQKLPSEAIEAEIKDLRDRDKVLDRAKHLKPVLDKYNEQQVAAMYHEQQRQKAEQDAYWRDHTQKVKKALSGDTVSGLKLKKQDREMALAALAKPDPQLGGLGIYAVIDNLLQKGEFELLTEMVILGINKKGYYEYVGSNIEKKVSENTQRMLRTSATSTPVSADVDDNANRPKLERPIKKEWFSSYNKK